MNNDKAEILWRMYNEHVTMGRHHETQRSAMSQIILAVAGALVAFFGTTTSPQNKWVVALFIVLLGAFGVLFSAKPYERSKFHMGAAGLHRKELEGIVGVDLGKIRKDAEDNQRREFPCTEGWSLNQFWTRLHVLIAMFGVVLLWQALHR